MFTGPQRRHLHGVSLSRIICDNSHITHVPADPFSRTERPEDMLPCSHPLISHLDLRPWKEPDSCEKVDNKTTSGRSTRRPVNISARSYRSRLRSDTQSSIRLLLAL